VEIDKTGRISIIYLIMPQDLTIPKSQSWLSVFCGIQQLPAPQPYRWRAPNPLHTEPQRCPVKCYIYLLISFGWIDGSTTSGGLLCRDMMERRLGLAGARSIYHRRTSPTVYPQLFRTILFTSLHFNSIQFKKNHSFRNREAHFLHPFTTHSPSNPLPLPQLPIISLRTHCIRPSGQALVPLSHAVKLCYKKGPGRGKVFRLCICDVVYLCPQNAAQMPSRGQWYSVSYRTNAPGNTKYTA
jgi:hypothetical protein